MFSHLRTEIAAEYARNAGVEVELEARFGEFRGRNFTPGVSLSSFQRIEEFFSAGAKAEQKHTTDYIRDNIRKTVLSPITPDGREEVTWMRKTRAWNHDVPDYNLRLSMSREEAIDPVPNFVHTETRVKHRRSYVVFNGTVRVDLTVVGQRYEVEVELLNQQSFPNFDRGVQITLQKLLNTLILYTTGEANILTNYINGILQGRKPYVIDHTVLVQARDLNLKDLVIGGLVGNPDTGYTVTHKADGERKLLVFHESGVWLVMAPRHFNKILDLKVPQLYGTIIDGEELSPSKRRTGAPAAKYWFLAFDCMARRGDGTIQNLPHSQRMEFCQVVVNYISSLKYQSEDKRILAANTKDFRGFNTVNEFYDVMNGMFDEQDLLPYHQDGFMFTPSATPYNSGTDQLPLFQRVLTRYPDICKWKPKEKLTIDFQIQWGRLTPEGKRTLVLFSGNMPGQPNNLVQFTGTLYNPFDATTVDAENQLTLNLVNDSIVEYAWDYQSNILYPVRVRHEKTRPNRIDRVENIWDLIQHPLDAATMKGDDFTLVFAYHNRIKKAIYNFASPKGRDNMTLLDIGSGRGGDVAKWKKFSRIVAVEPNGEHIVELRRRLELQGMTDRVMIVQCGGQDTATITAAVQQFLGGPADVVSMMLSLSFFWQNREIFEALVTTIRTNMKLNGNFVFMTIDGDAVQQLFDPMFQGFQLSELRLGPATLNYNPPQLNINMPGTIVGEQQEWLVRLGDFLLRDFQLVELHRADGEGFLSAQENIYTKMYTFGALAKNKQTPGLIQTPVVNTMITVPATPLPTARLPTRLPVATMPMFTPVVTIPMAPIPALTSPGRTTMPVPTSPRPTAPVPRNLNLPTIPTLAPRVVSPPLPRVQSPPRIDLPPMTAIPHFNAPTIPTILLPQVPTMAPMQTLPVTLPMGGPAGFPQGLPPGLPMIPALYTQAPGAVSNFNYTPMPVQMGPQTVSSLPVRRPNAPGQPGIGDDTYRPMTVPWYDNVVRIAAIGDGSCFFHAVLKGYLIIYQDNPSYAFRQDFVAKFRRDLAYLLQLPAGEANTPQIIALKTDVSQLTRQPVDPITFYDNAANGAFLEFFLLQLQNQGDPITDDDGVPLDFSLPGMQQLFNSYRDVGYEVYQYAADMMGIDIFVTIGYTDNLKPFINTQLEGREPRPAVVIVGNKHHYEVIGIMKPEGIQTVFMPDDIFLTLLKQQRA